MTPVKGEAQSVPAERKEDFLASLGNEIEPGSRVTGLKDMRENFYETRFGFEKR
ncbi:hypothetical protein L21SP2_2850 [Salinispira pacifica]|uniref:Uncharacterized protein n=1 Tax=Salinispira pacifica TaxID=1307761 RepID=V5WKB8_9SPIO|nr:hypothetical protein L21SP2_2850 [Salinispira pacifica]